MTTDPTGKVKGKRKKAVWKWLHRHLGGHIVIGPLTIYGFNAMHVALNLKTRWGYLCFHPTIRFYYANWPWYLYLSPNATPWAATWGVGPGIDREDKAAIKKRRAQ